MSLQSLLKAEITNISVRDFLLKPADPKWSMRWIVVDRYEAYA